MTDSITENDTKELIDGMLDDENSVALVTDSAVNGEESTNDVEVVATVEDEPDTDVSGKLLLEEILHISRLAELYRVLSSCIDKKQDVLLDASQVKKVDAVSLQMIAAFYQSAPANEINVDWEGCSDSFKAASELVGLTATLGIDVA